MAFIQGGLDANYPNVEHVSTVMVEFVHLLVKPGISGLAQVNGYRGETDTVEKMKARIDYDLAYLRNWSVLLDLQIVLKTVVVVLRKQNAY